MNADRYPTVDESLDRLHRAGWSIGDAGFGSKLLTWQVSGTNGENLLVAYGFSRAEAWWKACVQARALGMLAPPRCRTRTAKRPATRLP